MIETKQYVIVLETSKRARPSRREGEIIGKTSLEKGIHFLNDGTFLEITPKEFFPWEYPGNHRNRYRVGVMMRIINGVVDVDESRYHYPRKLKEGIFMETGDYAPLTCKLAKNKWIRIV